MGRVDENQRNASRDAGTVCNRGYLLDRDDRGCELDWDVGPTRGDKR
jgi:hypothetical protein